MPDADIIVFDIDGTLVDTSDSYTEVIRATTRRYLQLLIIDDLEENAFISRDQVTALKNVGGFNNDWDLVASVLHYYAAQLPVDKAQLAAASQRLCQLAQQPDRVAFFDNEPLFKDVLATDLLGQGDLSVFIRELENNEIRGLLGVVEYLGLRAREDFVLYRGQVCDSDIVTRIYQEYYQGPELFWKNHGQQPVYYKGEGFYLREHYLVAPKLLKKLALSRHLAVITGRIRTEAKLVLERFGLAETFDPVLTDDDVSPEYRKPAPDLLYMLAEIAGWNQAYLYIGDNPDDVRMANSAKERLAISSVLVHGQHPEADYSYSSVEEFLSELYD